MKLNCGPSWETKWKRKQEWHAFFAIWPRRVAENDCRWLELIERKGTYWDSWGHGGWNWEYRCRS